MLQDFVKTQEEQGVIELEKWVANFNEYVRSEEVQKQLIQDFENINSDGPISEKLTEIVQNYFTSYVTLIFDQAMKTLQKDFVGQMKSKFANLPSEIEKALTIDKNLLAQAFKFNIN